MAVFRVERTGDYTVMSNFHLKDKRLSLKAKGLLSQMLSLPDDWDYTLSGLSYINRESKDAIRSAVNELETAGYSKKFREEHEKEILLHQAAKNAFDEMGVKKLPKVKELQTEYAKLLEEKKKTYAEYRRSREEMRELLTAKANVDRVLKMEVEQDVEKEKDHGQR